MAAPVLDVRGLAAAIDDAEVRIREAVPDARVIYIEPDIERAPDGAPVG